MNHKDIEAFLLSFEQTWVSYPFDEKTAVFYVGEKDSADATMFALIAEGTNPLRLSLRCDPLLAETLREQYETVTAGQNLNKKNWNTILCTGQVDDQELQGFVRLSYSLATK